jgi:hypothetical protein
LTKTKVVNCSNEPYDVFIGRPSKWGNPFVIGKDGTRSEVVEKYKKTVVSNPDLIKSLDELDGKVLGCFCKPKACHGDALIELIEHKKRNEIMNALFDEKN